MDGQDTDLGIVHDGRGHDAAQGAEAGDGEGRTAEVTRRHPPILGRHAQAIDLACEIEQRAAIRVANHRHHQALGRLGRDADVILTALHDFAGRLVEGGVELRVLSQGLDRRLHEEGQVGELDAVPGHPPLGLVAQFDQFSTVDLLDVGELRDLALG